MPLTGTVREPQGRSHVPHASHGRNVVVVGVSWYTRVPTLMMIHPCTSLSTPRNAVTRRTSIGHPKPSRQKENAPSHAQNPTNQMEERTIAHPKPSRQKERGIGQPKPNQPNGRTHYRTPKTRPHRRRNAPSHARNPTVPTEKRTIEPPPARRTRPAGRPCRGPREIRRYRRTRLRTGGHGGTGGTKRPNGGKMNRSDHPH